jgi:uncharacterized protein with GYD domain
MAARPSGVDEEMEDVTMPLYLTQFAYTAETWEAMTRNPEDRTSYLEGFCRELGGRLVGMYYAFGEYDGFVILEAPDEAAASAFAVAVAASGSMRALRTTTLLTPAQLVALLPKVAGVRFRPAGRPA